MTREEIGEFFRLHEKALRAHDLDALMALYAEDCVVESPIFGVVTGRAAIEQAWRISLTRIPDLRTETEKIIVMGDEVARVFTATGTDLGGFYGTQESKPFRTQGVLLYVMKTGQIAHERRLYDVNGILLQKVEQELKTAAEIQQALLPHGRYCRPGFEIAATSVPCRKIGGDFFDFFDLPNGGLGLVLGDVAGKGPPAALLATMLQGLFAARTRFADTPGNTLDYVNRATLRRAIEARFATLVYAELSSDGCLTYCNAGHNPPVLYGARGLRRLTAGGPIVGAFEDAVFCEERLQLDPGDVLVVYSDGITEALNNEGEEFGDDRFVSCVQANRGMAAAEPLLDCLLESVRSFTVGAVQNDDLTILTLRYDGPQPA